MSGLFKAIDDQRRTRRRSPQKDAQRWASQGGRRRASAATSKRAFLNCDLSFDSIKLQVDLVSFASASKRQSGFGNILRKPRLQRAIAVNNLFEASSTMPNVRFWLGKVRFFVPSADF